MNIELLFKPFLSTDKNRPWMCKINEQEGYCYATDAHVLIRCPSNKVEWSKYPPHEKTATFSRLFESYNYHEPIVYSLDVINTALKKFTKVYDRIECEQCDGEGKSECDMGHLHDCIGCDGLGYNNSCDLVYPFDDKTLIKIQQSYLSPFHISKLAEVMVPLGADKCALIANKNDVNGAKVFVIQDFEIVIAPFFYENIKNKEKAQLVELKPIIKKIKI